MSLDISVAKLPTFENTLISFIVSKFMFSGKLNSILHFFNTIYSILDNAIP
ncbi:hypothetical protein [uncultured Tyzzerella sp.]|uniref:hypothetical protein n=1 Tax=uncultured Tyzzerella sp. TaxID=2321398 RepID=UPI0034DD8762